MEPTVVVDQNRHSAIKVLDGRKNVHVILCDGHYKVARIPKYLFARQFSALEGYPLQRAAQKFLEHAAIHGATDRARSILQLIAKEGNMAKAKEITQAEQDKAILDSKVIRAADWPPATAPGAEGAKAEAAPAAKKSSSKSSKTKKAEQPSPTEGKATATQPAATKEPEMATKAKTTKKTAPKKADKPQAKGDAKSVTKKAPAKKDGALRRGAPSKHPLEAKITLVEKENPKREGTRAHKEFELYKRASVKTVGDYIKAGGTMAYLNYDADQGFIKVSAK